MEYFVNDKDLKKFKIVLPQNKKHDLFIVKLIKSLVYESDFDDNGLIYLLGTDFKSKEWKNPAEKTKDHKNYVKITNTKMDSGSDQR